MTSWLAEVPFSPAPPHHRMGVHALDDDRWLLGGVDLAAQLAEKDALVRHRPDEVVAWLAGSEAGGDETADLVDAWLHRHRPDAPPASGGRHGIDRAARRIAEDLCLLERRDDRWILTAASLCFPSRWRLADKLGQPVDAIHGPVPHYDAELSAPVDRFLDRLRPDRPVWRRNWTLHADAALHQPTSVPPGRPVAPRELHLRSEYQTLRLLPTTSAVLFTIRTQQAPLVELVDEDQRHRLAAVLRGLDPPLAGYKAGDFDPVEVADWLETSR